MFVYVPQECPIQLDMPYVVKIFDPRFMRSADDPPWSPTIEAAAAHLHGGEIQYNPRQMPSMRGKDHDEDPVEFERAWFEHTTWMHHNECRAYTHLARLQGFAVPTFYGSRTLDLSQTDPSRSISPFVLVLEYVRDAVPLSALDPRLLTEPLIHAIIGTGGLLQEHGVIHQDVNEANFLLAPAASPVRVVVIDFAESWTRDAAVDEADWEAAKREWGVEHDRRVMVHFKLRGAGLPIPKIAQLPPAP